MFAIDCIVIIRVAQNGYPHPGQMHSNFSVGMSGLSAQARARLVLEELFFKASILKLRWMLAHISFSCRCGLVLALI